MDGHIFGAPVTIKTYMETRSGWTRLVTTLINSTRLIKGLAMFLSPIQSEIVPRQFKKSYLDDCRSTVAREIHEHTIDGKLDRVEITIYYKE